MFKESCAKYYQENKEKLQKKCVKDLKIYQKKKISLKMKRKAWFSTEKIL